MTEAIEQWHPVIGWEHLYEVSSLGRLRSLPRSTRRSGTRGGQILKPCANRDGYMLVTLCGNGQQKERFVAQLVAEAFIGPRPTGLHCCHNDGNPTNNAASNLRWATPAENAADRHKHGKTAYGEINGHSKLTKEQVLAIRVDTRTQQEIAADYEIHQAAVSRIKRRKAWAHIP